MRRVLTCLILGAMGAGSLCASGSDWPQFLGPTRDGLSPDTGINKDWKAKPPKLLWKVPMHDGGYAGPSVANGQVYIIDHKGDKDIVRAIELKSGRDAWTFEYADSPRGNYGFARSTPVAARGGLYTVSRLGLVHCLYRKTGQKAWSVDLRKRFGARPPKWQMAWSPLVDGDKLIVIPGGPDATVACLDRKTGKTIWKGGGGDKPGYATPVKATLDGKEQYVVFTARNVIGVSADNGRRLWNYPWKTSYDVNASTPRVVGDTVFITSDYGRGGALLRISKGRAALVWQNRTIQSHFSTPILWQGHLYGTTTSGWVVCMDWKTGATKWKTRGFEKGGQVGIDGTFIVVDGRRSDIVMFEMVATGLKELGRMQGLGGQSWTAPIVADGKLIVRNKTSLACFDLK